MDQPTCPETAKAVTAAIEAVQVANAELRRAKAEHADACAEALGLAVGDVLWRKRERVSLVSWDIYIGGLSLKVSKFKNDGTPSKVVLPTFGLEDIHREEPPPWKPTVV